MNNKQIRAFIREILSEQRQYFGHLKGFGSQYERGSGYGARQKSVAGEKIGFESKPVQDMIANVLSQDPKIYQKYLEIKQDVDRGFLLRDSKRRMARLLKDVKPLMDDKEFVKHFESYFKEFIT